MAQGRQFGRCYISVAQNSELASISLGRASCCCCLPLLLCKSDATLCCAALALGYWSREFHHHLSFQFQVGAAPVPASASTEMNAKLQSTIFSTDRTTATLLELMRLMMMHRHSALGFVL